MMPIERLQALRRFPSYAGAEAPEVLKNVFFLTGFYG